MNKYLILTAAALAAASTAVATDASAKGGSGSATLAFLTTFGSATFCDTLALSWNGSAAAGVHDFIDGCGFPATVSHESGTEGKVKKVGKEFVMGDNFYAYYYGINWVLQYNLSAPIASSGTWQGFYTTDGVTSTEFRTGGYITEGAASKHIPKSKSSTLSKLNASLKVMPKKAHS